MVTRRIIEYFKKRRRSYRTPCQRKHPRLRAFNLIKFTLADGTHYESISNIVDISENGLKFTCYERLEPGDALKMLVAIPSRSKEVPIDAKLVWIRRMKNIRGVYLAGVVFHKIAETDREIIRDMVERQMKMRKH